MNILIIKTGALGDVVRTSWIAQALKDKFKNSKIFWITDKKATSLFINNPYVTQILIPEKKNSLKKLKWDLIINLEEDEESCKFATSLNPREIQGFHYKYNKIQATSTTKDWFEMSAIGSKPQNDILKKQNKKTHREIISEIIKIKEYKKYEPFLRLTEKQRRFANEFLRRHNLSRSNLIIGINTGSAGRWPKQLSIKKTAKLIDELYSKSNAKIILFGGPEEIERNQQIHKLSNSPIIDTGTGNNLLEFPALISVCSLLITSDTLGLHISLALKRKTIALIGPTSNTEIDMYGFGEKVISKSDCLCCYNSDCKSMEKITIEDIISAVKNILSQKITLLITAYNEPHIEEAVKSALNQKTNYKFEVIISAPDQETLDRIEKYKKYSNFKTIKDPGVGKSFALNHCFPRINTDILILSDGDTNISENTIEEIASQFSNPEIGCVTGRPTPQELKNTKYGFWAHFLFDSAHRIRKQASESSSFIECSGYLFAFRKKRINQIPIDVAEDTVIPYLLWQKGYKIGYAEKARVYVKNANNWKDWLKQKTRTHKSHEKLALYVDTKTTPKVKTFKTEIKGIVWLMQYPQNLKELIWANQLAISRLLTWIKYYFDTTFFSKHYRDGWERIESTK